MIARFALLTAVAALAALGAAEPLRLNLGAYSPALLVGDSAATFEGTEKGI
jgi:hypothetical protein